MIEVTVRWFAAFRELTGVEHETCKTSATTPAGLFDEMISRHEALGARSASLVAVNGQMADWESPLNTGDEILFFPPVAGG